MDTELREILDKVKSGEMQTDEAHWKICVLFNDSNSEERVPFCHIHNEQMTFDTNVKEHFCYSCEYGEAK